MNGGVVARGGAARARTSRRARIAPARSWSRRSGATRRCSSRASSHARATRSASSPRGCRARSSSTRRRARRAVGLRQRSRSAAARAARSASARCSRRRRAACVPFREHDLAQRRPTGRSSPRRAQAWAAKVFPSVPRGRAARRGCGRPSRGCAGSIAPIRSRRGRRISRRSRARSDYLNREALRGAALPRAGHRPDGRAAGRPSVGERRVGEPQRASSSSPNLPTEEVFTIAAPRPRRRHRARDQAAQLRRAR